VGYPSLYSKFSFQVWWDVEGEQSPCKVLNKDAIIGILKKCDMADFINHVTIEEIKASGGWAELVEALRDLDIAQ
jgi:hypothetical protein